MLSESRPRRRSANRRRATPQRTAQRRQVQGLAASPHHATTIRGTPPPPAHPRARSTQVDRVPTRANRFYAAGFWRRTLGGLIDLSIILPISLLLAWVAGALTGIQLPTTTHSGLDYWLDVVLEADPAFLGIAILTVTVFATYSLVFLATLGRSPGMIATRTRIIDLYGERPGVLHALLRTASSLVSIATLGLGFLWVAADRRKRGLTDWLSGTHVVKV